jgi:tRNA threonylcarbamoyladenosine modification (KEOPS) complex  Pcc1 subunit
MDLKQTGRNVVVQLNEAQDRDGLRALLKTVMNLVCVKK